MKKILKIAISALMMLGLVACSSNKATNSNEDYLDVVKNRGKLIVALEGTWAPWGYHDETNNLVGYDVELGALIAEKLGVEVEYVEGEWDGLFAGLDAGRYDMIINGVDITEDRAAKYDFSTPYAYSHTAIIVKEENNEIKTFEDLNGKSTANTLQSTYAQLAEKYGATPTGVDDLNQTIELLLAGRIDATLNSEDTYYDYKKEHPEAAIKIAAITVDANEVAIPMPKGNNAKFVEAVNKAINELKADGTLAKLSNKYFERDITK